MTRLNKLQILSQEILKIGSLDFDLSNAQGWDSIDLCLKNYKLSRGPSFGKNKFYLKRDNGNYISDAYLYGTAGGVKIISGNVPLPEKSKIKFNKDIYSSPGAIYDKNKKD